MPLGDQPAAQQVAELSRFARGGGPGAAESIARPGPGRGSPFPSRPGAAARARMLVQERRQHARMDCGLLPRLVPGFLRSPPPPAVPLRCRFGMFFSHGWSTTLRLLNGGKEADLALCLLPVSQQGDSVPRRAQLQLCTQAWSQQSQEKGRDSRAESEAIPCALFFG